ncbi:hypothetical protein [Altererythrobacter lauratis]|uniref:Glycerophosphoryl diester phosphodiesterase membrane domain-containing protein n=1 Tax=Alteraurantiacibacter lauratis TaxID=2054627 RepID=A0ABV7ECD1_9SPHN
MSERLSTNQRAVLTYLAIFIPATAIASWLDISLGLSDEPALENAAFGRNNGLFGLLVLVASVAGQCWLFGQMLGKRDVAGRYLGFLGLAVLTFLGVAIGFVMLVIPGLIIGARWLMAPSIYVDQGRGVFEAMRESWHRTLGNTGQIMLALILVLVVIVLASAALGGMFFFATENGPVAFLVEAVVSEVFAVILLALSVATYGLLSGQSEKLASVFD